MKQGTLTVMDSPTPCGICNQTIPQGAKAKLFKERNYRIALNQSRALPMNHMLPSERDDEYHPAHTSCFDSMFLGKKSPIISLSGNWVYSLKQDGFYNHVDQKGNHHHAKIIDVCYLATSNITSATIEWTEEKVKLRDALKTKLT